MPLTGYLKIPDIPGESRAADHEDEIDFHELEWRMFRDTSGATVGRGRRRSRSEVEPLAITKFTDAASPYLMLANLQGKSFDEIIISVRKDSGEAHLDYLVITLTNCVITSIEMDSFPSDQGITERVAIVAEELKVTYTVQADDHSSGDEHEITYDIAAGA